MIQRRETFGSQKYETCFPKQQSDRILIVRVLFVFTLAGSYNLKAACR